MAGDQSEYPNPVARINRRRFLAAFMTLAAWLKMTRPSLARSPDDNQTVVKGGWLLKRSDLP